MVPTLAIFSSSVLKLNINFILIFSEQDLKLSLHAQNGFSDTTCFDGNTETDTVDNLTCYSNFINCVYIL